MREEQDSKDVPSPPRNDYAKGISIACQAISEEHSALVGRTCVLLEAIIPDKEQCNAAKKTAKSIIREEQKKLMEYLSTRAWPLENQIIPAEYKQEE